MKEFTKSSNTERPLRLTSALVKMEALINEDVMRTCEVPGCKNEAVITATFAAKSKRVEINPLRWFGRDTNTLCGEHLLVKLIDVAMVVSPQIESMGYE